MNIKSKLKRSGFSLMELTLAVLIVAILIVITVPIINRQLEKSEEYSYYAAYRTVEKMSGQIVALGDPEEESFALKHKDSFINNMIAIFNDSKLKISRSFTSYKEKFANSEMFFFTRLFPKTIAEEIVAISWTSSTLDDLWLGYYVCNNYSSGGNSNIQKGDTQQEVETVVTNADGTTSTKKETKTVQTYYTVSDFNCCVGYTKSASSTSPVVCKALKANGAPQEYVPQSGETCCPSFSSSCTKPCYNDSSGKTYENIVVNSGKVNDIIKNNLYSDPDTCDPNKSGSGASRIAYLLKKATLSVSDGNYKINMNAKSICENTFINSCSGQTSQSKFYESDGSAGGSTYKDDEDKDDDSVEGDPTPYSETMGACTVYKSVDMSSGTYTSSSYSPVRPTYSSDWCSAHGYVNMTNAAAPNSIDCVPNTNYRISANNEKVACLCINDGETAYATGNSANPCVCTSRDFNEVTKEPCGVHEVYSGGDKCECVPGWRRKTESAQYCEERGTCPKGTTLSGDVCVVNPPIVSAKRFCELIAENWNVSSKSCNKFTDDVYTSVYNAALGSDTNKTYLSIQSQQGEFKSITPNIILSNGMRLWILGNKAASIPGLSYYSDPATMPINKKQNMCEKVAVETHTAEACMTATGTVSYGGKSYNKGYFCANDKNCFKLSDASYPTTTRTTELLDARGCCAASDYTDFHEKAKTSVLGEDVYMQDPTVYSIGGFTIFVDINGAKGDGTLWDDVYPFYISSNGTVYPAYPLDAEKEKYKADGVTEASNALYIGGNSDKQLPTDVYYYEASSSGKAREKKIAFANVSYARAVCSARKVSRYTPYCLNLGKRFKGKGIFPKAGGGYEEVDLPENYIMLSRNSVKSKDSHNPCDYYVCYVAVKNKTRFF